MNIIKKIELNREQILEELYEWAETFDWKLDEDEEKTDSLVTKKRMGMNRLFASDLRIYLDSGEVCGITYFDKPDGIFYPMDKIRTDEQFIKGFQWNPLLRPKDPISMMEK